MNIQNFSFRLPSVPKLICSLPVIIITLYFVAPLGVALTIARLFIYGSYRYYRVPFAILIVALLCLAPRGYELLQQNFSNITPVFQPFIDFRAHPMFAKLTDFGRWTAIFSIIMLIASQILSKVANFVSQAIRMASMGNSTRATSGTEQKRTPVMRKDGREADPSDQATPHVVKCPNCGKANHIIGTVGNCKACRSAIEWSAKK